MCLVESKRHIQWKVLSDNSICYAPHNTHLHQHIRSYVHPYIRKENGCSTSNRARKETAGAGKRRGDGFTGYHPALNGHSFPFLRVRVRQTRTTCNSPQHKGAGRSQLGGSTLRVRSSADSVHQGAARRPANAAQCLRARSTESALRWGGRAPSFSIFKG